MVTDRQVRRLLMELGTGTPLSIAAMRAGMSEPTARRYRTDPLPSPRTVPRAYRTRRDPFAALWPEIEALLVQAPGLEAVTIFEALRGGPTSSWRTGSSARYSAASGAGGSSPGPSARACFPKSTGRANMPRVISRTCTISRSRWTEHRSRTSSITSSCPTRTGRPG